MEQPVAVRLGRRALIRLALLAVTLLAPPIRQSDMRDRFHIKWEAERAGVDPRLALAFAWVETQTNTDPRVRDRTCWYPGYRSRDCAIGRFQIKPSTARTRCPGDDVKTYRGNVACFLKMLSEDVMRFGLRKAIRTYNHSDDYVASILTAVGEQAIEEAA